MPGSFRVTLRKSPISYTERARGTVRALGLHRVGETVEVVDNPATRGMARAIRFLVEVEEIEATTTGEARASEAGAAPNANATAQETDQ